MEMRLARVLRHVLEGMSVPIDTLALNTARGQRISEELAFSYIGELVADNYLDIDPEDIVRRGTAEYPPEIISGGYYVFVSVCWSCDKAFEKQLDIYSGRVHWECHDCDVKWSEDVL